MGESILKLQQIRKSFDHTEVLKGVDLEVAQGEFITLLGASGCGKTTTLRIIAGLELPDSGSVILEGRDITDWEPNKRDVNTVFQNYALFPHMNVADNVGYGLKIRKVPKAEITERVKQALRLVQLEEYEKRMPDQLSGGQRQRIAIARAVINEPKVLLLDEPLGALDLKLRRQMQLELKRLQKQLGITFIYITHDLGVVAKVADYVNVMYAGKIVEKGSIDEIFYDPKHPYTWGLLSAMPDLNTADSRLFTIPGSPPNLQKPVCGDAFAPRNKYALKIDSRVEPPMFKISDSHFAATWLLHPLAPKVEMPEELKKRIIRMKEEAAV